MSRTYDPGWEARIDDGQTRPVMRVNSGLQAVRLEGTGTKHVTLRYRAPRLVLWATISLVSASALVVLAGVSLVRCMRSG